MLKLHVLQHASFLGPGTIETWACQNKFSITRTKFFEPEWALPKLSDIDLLVIMGGPMTVFDEGQYPWLVQEKNFIKQAIDADKKVLGICLGAQLIASVLGAEVYNHEYEEIGWFEIEKPKSAMNTSALNIYPDSFLAFHWHGYTFDLPEGAQQIYRSKACEQQAFVIGSNVLALQFHMEVTAQAILGFIEHNNHESVLAGKFVQTASQIKDNLSKTESLRSILFDMLDNFVHVPGKQRLLSKK